MFSISASRSTIPDHKMIFGDFICTSVRCYRFCAIALTSLIVALSIAPLTPTFVLPSSTPMTSQSSLFFCLVWPPCSARQSNPIKKDIIFCVFFSILAITSLRLLWTTYILWHFFVIIYSSARFLPHNYRSHLRIQGVLEYHPLSVPMTLAPFSRPLSRLPLSITAPYLRSHLFSCVLLALSVSSGSNSPACISPLISSSLAIGTSTCSRINCSISGFL